MAIFTGAGVALVTPMKDNGEINYEVLDKLIEDQIAGHTDAIIICGTTGEAPTLEDDEHLEAIRFTVALSSPFPLPPDKASPESFSSMRFI